MIYSKKNNTNNIPNDFNWKVYLDLNTDLPRNYKLKDCIKHYLTYGQYENRIYKNTEPLHDFDDLVYISKPDDSIINTDSTSSTSKPDDSIINTDSTSSTSNIPNDFNWKVYLELNADLPRNYKLTDCLKHYLTYGQYEKRNYKKLEAPKDFDWIVYLEKNIDLPRYFSEQQCIQHYFRFGQYENRIFKKFIGLDTLIYKDNNFINACIFNIILEYIKLTLNLPISWNTIVKNHEKINNIIENYSNIYENLNKKIYLISNESKNDMIKTNLNEDMTLIIDTNHINQLANFKKVEYNYLINSLINIYDSFIFILDLPENHGGGTKEFINNIYFKYSKHNNFLFLLPNKNDDNLYNIYISDMKIVELNVSQIINVINLINEKIDKIFCNHILFFSNDLLKFIFSLKNNIKKTIITHDHFLLTNNLPQTTIDFIYNFISEDEEDEDEDEECQNINYIRHNDYIFDSVDTIISQNIKNIYLIKQKYLHKLIISDLPDFYSSDEKFITSNNTINILFIGGLHSLKGGDFVEFLIRDYYKDTNINYLVLGALSNFKNKHTHLYSNIDEFNKLLINFKPNLIVETSVWPETYSYTLTLSMLTQLPILILKKPFHSVIEERVKDYNNVFFYSSLRELNTLIHSKKQDFFYSIKPIVYFNMYWDNYFNYQYNQIKVISDQFNDHYILNSMYKKNVVFITSKIHVSNVELSYSNSRSIYTNEERLNQTIITINSIKKYIPDVFIVLFDNSTFNNIDFNILKNSVDYFINPYYDKGFLDYFTNKCKYKCLAELSQLIYAYYYFFKHLNFTRINNFFKISGRYYINDNFDFTTYENDNLIFKKNQKVIDRRYLYTSFYKLPNHFLPEFFNTLLDIYYNKQNYFNKDLEVIFSEKFEKYTTLVDTLGITQIFSCWNFTDII